MIMIGSVKSHKTSAAKCLQKYFYIEYNVYSSYPLCLVHLLNVYADGK